MIQRRVKWKRGVTVQNDSMQARESLGKSRGLKMSGVLGEGGGMGFHSQFGGLEKTNCLQVKSVCV